ncbi:unnamed protein product [Rotaria magnacalcarata]|uniref:OTU domain-containing protein n=1 Tax=Rotaria magnacalcarata TaxID=392030 RepID=A0A819Z4B8_9BILA|nr:unnamed protein product [Rotaria magnacalcarata]CAF4165235.1 unnamed protein product [Rotaria magnacalcarata]
MKEMKRKQPIFQQSSNYLNILSHNIEGLKCNFNAFRNHHLTQNADFICLTETWLSYKNLINKFDMNGYHLIHKSRSSSFSNDHLPHSRKHGGIAVYYRNSISVQEIDSCEHLNLEHITFELLKEKIIIVNCYRSPQQKKTEFLTNLDQHLKEIGIERKIILIGDLNENSLSEKSKPIETKLNTLGFVNIYQNLATTNSLTSLDCFYCNFKLTKDHHKGIGATYYSFHDTLIFSINTEYQTKDLNIEFEYNDEENMELDNTIVTPVPMVKISKTTSKRKNDSEHTNTSKILKTTTISPTKSRNEDIMKEKQRNFLKNMKYIIEKSILEKGSHTITLTEQLALIGLKKVKILGDGSCFFRAILHQLNRNQNDHLLLRSEVINHLIKNKDFFLPFLDETYLTFDKYIEEMSKSVTYVDHLGVTATAVLIKKNIIIHELGKKPILVPGSDFVEDQVHLCYYPNIHYDSIVSIDNNFAFLSFEDVIITS